MANNFVRSLRRLTIRSFINKQNSRFINRVSGQYLTVEEIGINLATEPI